MLFFYFCNIEYQILQTHLTREYNVVRKREVPLFCGNGALKGFRPFRAFSYSSGREQARAFPTRLGKGALKEQSFRAPFSMQSGAGNPRQRRFT